MDGPPALCSAQQVEAVYTAVAQALADVEVIRHERRREVAIDAYLYWSETLVQQPRRCLADRLRELRNALLSHDAVSRVAAADRVEGGKRFMEVSPDGIAIRGAHGVEQLLDVKDHGGVVIGLGEDQRRDEERDEKKETTHGELGSERQSVSAIDSKVARLKASVGSCT